jgi:hypothetical protein
LLLRYSFKVSPYMCTSLMEYLALKMSQTI